MKTELIKVEYLAQCLANRSKYIRNTSYHHHTDLPLRCLETYEREGGSKQVSKSIFKDNKLEKKALYKTMLHSQNSYLYHYRFSHIILA